MSAYLFNCIKKFCKEQNYVPRWEFWWVEANLRPLLEEYNAAFYISGHDHDQQRITKTGTNVEYIVTGGGHDRRYFKSFWQNKRVRHPPH